MVEEELNLKVESWTMEQVHNPTNNNLAKEKWELIKKLNEVGREMFMDGVRNSNQKWFLSY